MTDIKNALVSLTCLNRATDVTITQTIFAVCFTSGSFPHLARSLDALPGISPGIHLPLSFDRLDFLITDTIQ